jgi:uncharacterized protein
VKSSAVFRRSGLPRRGSSLALYSRLFGIGLNDRPVDHGIKDYDILCFDLDTSYEAEDDAIARAKTIFCDLKCALEVRNHTRVHLWYCEKFGVRYPTLGRATEGIGRFLMQHAEVGIRPRDAFYEVYAPRGFADIEHRI